MIVPDANLLLYAYNQGFKHHRAAKKWWENLLSGNEVVGLPIVVLFAFIRVSTNPKAFPSPYTPEEAIEIVQSWLARQNVLVLEVSHHSRTFDLIKECGTAGNLVTDAQIAAIAIAEGATVHSSDADFHRFPALKVFNPLAD